MPGANGIETAWDVVVDARCQAQRCTDLAVGTWIHLGDLFTCAQERVIITDTNALVAQGFPAFVGRLTAGTHRPEWRLV